MTHNIPTELQRYVQERIIPQYAGFDKAHQIDHAEKVIEESLKWLFIMKSILQWFIRLPLITTWVYARDVNFIISFRGEYCWQMKFCTVGLPMNKCWR